jgi:hypothetical protein
MPYEPFHERFPEVAERETRTFTAINDPDLPGDSYSLIEAYCNEPNCDCRRVFFNVYSERRRQVVAVIAYGWASRAHYVKWLGMNNPRIIRELQGPALNSASQQSELAPALLERIKLVVQDELYVDRLKRHYEMFKATVDRKAQSATRPAASTTGKVGRNAPCPCGSGKKYKNCCGRRA